MGWADRAGQATVDPQRPRAFGVCDDCGEWYNRHNLRDQYEWYGAELTDTHRRVCARCLSKPQDQLRPILLPPDPVPIIDPRPEYPSVLQNQNGFSYYVGPQGTTIIKPVVAELDPTMPLPNKAAVLASAASGWGEPMPATLIDRGGTITLSGVGQMITAPNPARTYLLLFNPASGLLAAAQGMPPVLGISSANVLSPTQAETGTIFVGTGSGVLQNGTKIPPDPVWLGSVWVLGLIPGQPFFAWENG